jgi:hypothetical protein
MSIKSLTATTVEKINAALDGALGEPEAARVSKIVEEALVRAVNESAKSCSNAAVVSCGPEADLAHKIAEDVDRARYALIANLTSMR